MKSCFKRLLCLSCALILWFGSAVSANSEIAESSGFTNLDLSSGLSQMSVMNIFQDSKGYMWFGTRNGLNKYDGAGMKVYKVAVGDGKAGLVNRQITAIAEDRHGNLWIGTSQGLSRLDMDKDEIISYGAPEYTWLDTHIDDIFIDSQERVWLGTAKGLWLFVPQSETGQPLKLNGELDNVAVTVVRETSDGRFVVGTQQKGVYICDSSFKKYINYSTDNILPDNKVSDILIDDKSNSLWVAIAESGIVRIDMATGDVRRYDSSNSSLSTNTIRCFARNDRQIFVGTFDGLYVIDIASGNLTLHSRADKGRGTLSHFSIYSLCIDRSGGVWVGTYSGGADYFSRYNNRFTLHEPTDSRGVISGIYGPMADGGSGPVYVATEGGGLMEYDMTDGRSANYLYDTRNVPSYSHNIVKSVLQESDTIWCGTSQGTVFAFDRKRRQFSLKYRLPNAASVYSLIRASDGCMWVATSKPSMSLVKISPDGTMKDRFEVADTLWRPGSSRCLFELRPGVMLIGSRNHGLYKYDEKSRKCVIYSIYGDGCEHLPSNYVTSILRDSKGRVWVSTFGGGLSLYDEAKGIVKTVNTASGLRDDDICVAVEDRNGLIWLSATDCIMRYNPADGSVQNYIVGNDIGAQAFTPHCGRLMRNGDICFSVSKGFVTFSPSNLLMNTYRPPVVFTELEVNNDKIVPSEGEILTVELDNTETVELAYNQNNITISYAALNFVNPDQNTYAIRLRGHDDEWHNVGNRRSAYYTNLKPGEYVFDVKAANNDGVWNEEARSIRIVVHPPVWATWYAYLFYAVLFFGTCFLIGYYIVKKKALEQRVHYQRLEQERSEEFHRTKLQMFTNFSHELRTPLTLILSPLEELLHRTDFNHGVKNKLSLIYNNSQRMLILVNQLMDLRKTQSGKMKLKVSKDDMCSFMQEMYCAFNHLAVGKEINFEYSSDEERLPAWFDKSVCDKVIFNLLSNAFKFTSPGDRIVMSLSRATEGLKVPEGFGLRQLMAEGHDFVHLSVCDTGRGIPPEDLVKIFDAFYQVEAGQSKEAAGTGIGLSLTRLIVELHHGIIWAENNPGGGAVFHVILPIDRGTYTDEEMDSDAAERVVVDVIPSEKPESIKLDRRYTVLLVEDTDEVRTYVRDCLTPYFDVIEADNGETAFELAVEKYPDIIVSDIMMPRKNGLELCEQIKEDLRTEHIPVILMTARCMVMHIKEGFSSGADDYIVKPFSMDVLIYRIRNILSSREKLKKLYGKKFSLESMGIKIVSAEDKFTQKFFEVIEKNIANPDLNIDMICREVGLSRTNLYRKLKAITDLSPIELIRNKRLEVATRLLRESDYTVSEISTYVGFNSHAYFTQCFKAAYGCSPSEYLAKERVSVDTEVMVE